MAHAQGLPANGRPETVYTYAIVLVIFGLLKSWVSPLLRLKSCCDDLISLVTTAASVGALCYYA